MVILVRCKAVSDSVLHPCYSKDEVIDFVSSVASSAELYSISRFVNFVLSSPFARSGDFLNISNFFVFCEEL